MVKIIAAHLREGKDGAFISLELQGEIDLVQSQTTGRFYATARRCFISSTFDEETAKQFVGSQIKGEIVRVECEPYEYKVPNSDEIIRLAHSWDYVPEEQQKNVVSKTVSQSFA